jgi:ABC-type nitrate/sulfonate/bicarbonate transport system substrate-binding protein
VTRTRRRLLAAGAAGLAGLFAGCTNLPGGGERTTAELRELHTIETEGSISDVTYSDGLDRGVWEDNGIDLDYEVAAFGKYNRQVVTGQSRIGAPSAVAQLKFLDKGEPLALVGQQLNMFNRMFARADDDSIESPADLSGKKVGLPASKTSTTSTVHRVLIGDEYDVDLLEDTAEVRAAPPPALWEFLRNGELDAISEFSGDTIKGMASEEVKTVFDPYRLWRERTGTELPTTAFTVRREWLENNAGTVMQFIEGWQDAVSAFEENVGEALSEYGEGAGISTDAEIQVVEEMVADGVIHGAGFYDDQRVTAARELVELLADAGVLDSRHEDENLFVTRSELESMAE